MKVNMYWKRKVLQKKRSNNTKSLKNGEGKEMINIQKKVLLTSKFFIK